MQEIQALDGVLFARMLRSGAANLKNHADEINDLNVFPIPDGDTGDNMLFTVMGGVSHHEEPCEHLGNAAQKASDGMLLSARGNSGVILSQFFEGMGKGFSGLEKADATAIGAAFQKGVSQAYSAVMTPTEGTILTVIREGTEYACQSQAETPEKYFSAFVTEAKRSLARTPELLPVLKEAGVVDSGAAGLIYMVDGMMQGIYKEIPLEDATAEKEEKIDFDAFDENSVLEFGYCTEVMLRLQRVKTDLEAFDAQAVKDYLTSVGDSVATVKSGSLLKIHVHTKEPHKVLAYCQQYGEFLKVKIENMSLQHENSVFAETEEQEKSAEKKEKTKPYGIVTVASGEGLCDFFRNSGADVVIEGGQTCNPSAENFLEAFDKVNAETIFVLPNNSNIILTAKQAASLYKKGKVLVVESTNIGEGYAAISMFDEGLGDAEDIYNGLTDAMKGVVTAEISHCVRDAHIGGVALHTGEYIGFVGKETLAVDVNRFTVACQTVEKLIFNRFDIGIVIYGCDVSEKEAEELEQYLTARYPDKEIYLMGGKQKIYDYIVIME